MLLSQHMCTLAHKAVFPQHMPLPDLIWDKNSNRNGSASWNETTLNSVKFCFVTWLAMEHKLISHTLLLQHLTLQEFCARVIGEHHYYISWCSFSFALPLSSVLSLHLSFVPCSHHASVICAPTAPIVYAPAALIICAIVPLSFGMQHVEKFYNLNDLLKHNYICSQCNKLIQSQKQMYAWWYVNSNKHIQISKFLKNEWSDKVQNRTQCSSCHSQIIMTTLNKSHPPLICILIGNENVQITASLSIQFFETR